jgi:hypothetical protein
MMKIKRPPGEKFRSNKLDTIVSKFLKKFKPTGKPFERERPEELSETSQALNFLRQKANADNIKHSMNKRGSSFLVIKLISDVLESVYFIINSK